MNTHRFTLSPLIRYSLYALFVSLTLPLPFLLARLALDWKVGLLIAGLGLGFGILKGLLSQQVDVDEQGIEISYAPWMPTWIQKGWSLRWSEVTDLYISSTSQGGLVYYLKTGSGEGYLLPMRIRGFRRFLQLVQTHTGLDTRSVNPFVQPWMYLALGLCAGLLLIVDGGLIWMSLTVTNV